jgi:hypothetical protein
MFWDVYKKLQYPDSDFNIKPYTLGRNTGQTETFSFSGVADLMSPGSGANMDTSLDDLLALAFHGTTALPNVLFSESSKS